MFSFETSVLIEELGSLVKPTIIIWHLHSKQLPLKLHFCYKSGLLLLWPNIWQKNLWRESLILVHGFRAFSPWSVGPTYLRQDIIALRTWHRVLFNTLQPGSRDNGIEGRGQRKTEPPRTCPQWSTSPTRHHLQPFTISQWCHHIMNPRRD
jgi:hypothetical protein